MIAQNADKIEHVRVIVKRKEEERDREREREIA